jgi:N-acetyl-alpha-D-glucosaminyl L-malate synthase BshA
MMSEVATRHGLDILHVHYAIPHAASAFLARELLGGRVKIITTLHGTDVTLVGQEPSFLPITRFVIQRSDAVTAVSAFLRDETVRVFGVDCPIEVIPNFVDTRLFRPRNDERLRGSFAAPDEKLLIHASNFRTVKNVAAVVEVFARVAARLPSRLLLIGDGPDLPVARELAARLGVADRVQCLGQVEHVAPILAAGDVMLLPSRHESFGLAALEAMSCGTPVIATNRGGTGEFIDDGHNSYLRDPDDYDGMAAIALLLLGDPGLHQQVAEEARRDAVERFGERCVLKRYLALYDRVLGAAPPTTTRR